MTITKENYFDFIHKINNLLHKNNSIKVDIQTKKDIEELTKMYDKAMDDHKKRKTIYGGKIVTNDK